MLSTETIFWRLTFAAALGAAIGIERDLRRRPAGIRTSAFVCLACALFTIVSGEISRLWGDAGPTRIASNIVQGIGFLGAGAILREGGGFAGLTTAATVFVEAAIGMAAGAGFYKVAGYSTALVLFGLTVLAWLAEKFHLKARMMLLRFTTSQAESVASEVQRELADLKVRFQHFRVSVASGSSIVELEADISHKKQEILLLRLSREGVRSEVLPVEGHVE